MEEAEERGWGLAWMVRASAYSTAFFIVALAVSLLTLGFVNPGPDPIAGLQVGLVWLSVGLTVLGGALMIIFVSSAYAIFVRKEIQEP